MEHPVIFICILQSTSSKNRHNIMNAANEIVISDSALKYFKVTSRFSLFTRRISWIAFSIINNLQTTMFYGVIRFSTYRYCYIPFIITKCLYHYILRNIDKSKHELGLRRRYFANYFVHYLTSKRIDIRNTYFFHTTYCLTVRLHIDVINRISWWTTFHVYTKSLIII